MKNFCETIGCPGKSLYQLKDFYCVTKRNPQRKGYYCIYLDQKGKPRKDATKYTNDRCREEIQIVAALIRSKTI